MLQYRATRSGAVAERSEKLAILSRFSRGAIFVARRQPDCTCSKLSRKRLDMVRDFLLSEAGKRLMRGYMNGRKRQACDSEY